MRTIHTERIHVGTQYAFKRIPAIGEGVDPDDLEEIAAPTVGAQIALVEYTGDGSETQRIIATSFKPKFAWFLRHDDYMFCGRVVYQSEDGKWVKALDSDNARDISAWGDGTPVFTDAGVDVGRLYYLWGNVNIEGVDYTLIAVG